MMCPDCVLSDLHAKLETEKSMRHKVEARLLETEKKNSEMGVDLMQLQQRVGTLQTHLQTEMDKVRSLCEGIVADARCNDSVCAFAQSHTTHTHTQNQLQREREEVQLWDCCIGEYLFVVTFELCVDTAHSHSYRSMLRLRCWLSQTCHSHSYTWHVCMCIHMHTYA